MRGKRNTDEFKVASVRHAEDRVFSVNVVAGLWVAAPDYFYALIHRPVAQSVKSVPDKRTCRAAKPRSR